MVAIPDLEFTAWRRDIGIDSAVIPAGAEDPSVQTVLLCTVALFSEPRSDNVT